MYGDTEPLQLVPPPVHNADEVLSPARASRDQHLPAEPAGRLEEHNLMAPLGTDPRRFEPGGPAADHDDLPQLPGAGHDVADRAFPSARWVVQAGGPVLRLAVSCADAGADAALEPGCDLRDDVGIGDMGAGHRDHVEKAVADCVPRGRDVGDAGGVEHRQADFALEGADLREPGRDGRCHAGHVVGRERRFSVHAPVDRVEKIDVAGVLEHPRDRDGVPRRRGRPDRLRRSRSGSLR